MKINTAHFNKMYDALKMIAQHYATPAQIKKSSKDRYGLGYEEALEMAYENIQTAAKEGIRNVRRFKENPKVVMESNGASQEKPNSSNDDHQQNKNQ